MTQTTLTAIAFAFVLDVFRGYEPCGTDESAMRDQSYRL